MARDCKHYRLGVAWTLHTARAPMQILLGGPESVAKSRTRPSWLSNVGWIVRTARRISPGRASAIAATAGTQRTRTLAQRQARKSRPLLRAISTAAVLQLGTTAAMAGISVDTVSSANSLPNTAASSLTFPHTVNAGSNSILLVSVHTHSGAVTVNSVTYGGTNLTQVGSVTASSNVNRAEIWRLFNPPTGTADVVVTLSGARNLAAGAVSYFGVDQASPLTPSTARGSSTTASVAVASASGEVVVDAVSADGDALSLTKGAGQTQQYNTNTGTANGNIQAAASTEAGAASVTMSWTLGASASWSIISVALKPAAMPAAFGDPSSATGYAFCVYSSTGGTPALVLHANVPPAGTCEGVPCWTSLNRGAVVGFRYGDALDRSQDGISRITLRASTKTNAAMSIQVQGFGPNLPVSTPIDGHLLNEDPNVIVQLVTSEGACWEGRYTAPTLVDRTDKFKDKCGARRHGACQ